MKTIKISPLTVQLEEKLRMAILKDSFTLNKSQAQIIREAVYSWYNYNPKKDEFEK